MCTNFSLSTSSETMDNINALNVDIRQALIDVLPIVSPELQLEITNLLKQIHHLNYLIYKKSGNWKIGWFKLSNDSTKFIFLLEEIKNILLIIKTNKISNETVRQFRINLQKEVNNHRYFFWGHILNILIYMYYVKSVPFKIFLGLSITTFVSIAFLNLSAKEIYKFDSDLSRKQIEQQELNSIPSQKSPTGGAVSTNQSPNILRNSYHKTDSNRHIWYALIYAATAGVLGSVASILLRIIDFHDQKYEDPLIPFFLGLLKPLIGLIFGIFVFSIISSDTIIKIDFLIAQDKQSSSLISDKARQDLFIFSCAFLVGFSERFASDLLKKTESSLIEK